MTPSLSGATVLAQYSKSIQSSGGTCRLRSTESILTSDRAFLSVSIDTWDPTLSIWAQQAQRLLEQLLAQLLADILHVCRHILHIRALQILRKASHLSHHLNSIPWHRRDARRRHLELQRMNVRDYLDRFNTSLTSS